MNQEFTAVFQQNADYLKQRENPYLTVSFTASDATPVEDLVNRAFSILGRQYDGDKHDDVVWHELALIAVTCNRPYRWFLYDGEITPETSETLVCGDPAALATYERYLRDHPIARPDAGSFGPSIPDEEIPF